jgi:hypothetical protein
MGSHSISKQCDILVYDSSKIPVIFRDEEFVVVRPESVRAVIEVKGSANRKEIGNTLKGLFDFGQKWRQCQLFYHEHHQPLTRSPSLFAMCWEIGKDKRGRPLTDGTKIRAQIANFYQQHMKLDELKGFPRLDKLFLYNDCEISKIGWASTDDSGFQEGYCSESGKFLRHDSVGAASRSGDRTVASLLAGLHYVAGKDFNRFYSYVDETRESVSREDLENGYTSWLTEDRYIRDANTDFVIDRTDR